MHAPARLGEWQFGGIASLFALAVLAQVFLAGDAALLAPEVWQAHVAWIHIFQWISVVLPLAAYLSVRRKGFALLNCVPAIIIGLQYSLVHIGIKRGDGTFVGLHAALGAFLFGYLVFVIQEWRYRTRLGGGKREQAEAAPGSKAAPSGPATCAS